MVGLSHCMALLRQQDPVRYLCCLYMPAPWREDVAAIWAFDTEISRIPAQVSEPLPGEIRMQWWRDTIRSGDAQNGAPVADALMKAIHKHNLPRENFHTYLEARTFDLYQDPMPDLNTLEGYLGETQSMMFHLAAQCAGTGTGSELADASGHAGVAYGLVQLLADTARYRNRQQMFVPLSVVSEHHLDRQSWLFETPGPDHMAVVKDTAKQVRMHLDKARSAVNSLPEGQRVVFRHLSIVPPILKLVDTYGTKLFDSPISLFPITRFWHLFRGKY